MVVSQTNTHTTTLLRFASFGCPVPFLWLSDGVAKDEREPSPSFVLMASCTLVRWRVRCHALAAGCGGFWLTWLLRLRVAVLEQVSGSTSSQDQLSWPKPNERSLLVRCIPSWITSANGLEMPPKNGKCRLPEAHLKPQTAFR
jgi:hypothetical protein